MKTPFEVGEWEDVCLLISISPESAFSKVQKVFELLLRQPRDHETWTNVSAFVRPAVNNNNGSQQCEKKAIKPTFCRLREEVEVEEGALPLVLQKG